MKRARHIVIYLVILAVVTAVCFNSTAYSDNQLPKDTTENKPNETTVEVTTEATSEITAKTTTEPVEEPTENPNTDDWLCIGESFDDPGWAAEGFLRYTVTNARIVDALPDASYVEDFAYEDFLLLVDDEGWVKQDLPVYINEDLSIKEGNYLIFVDVTVENVGARCNTWSNYDDDHPVSKYDDPYIFRSGFLYLINTDIPDPISDIDYVYKNTCYYSKMYDHPELPDNHTTYRLEPGETISFTVGYHLDAGIAQLAGHPVDMAKFCVTVQPDKSGQRVNLGLTGTITDK